MTSTSHSRGELWNNNFFKDPEPRRKWKSKVYRDLKIIAVAIDQMQHDKIRALMCDVLCNISCDVCDCGVWYLRGLLPTFAPASIREIDTRHMQQSANQIILHTRKSWSSAAGDSQSSCLPWFISSFPHIQLLYPGHRIGPKQMHRDSITLKQRQKMKVYTSRKSGSGWWQHEHHISSSHIVGVLGVEWRIWGYNVMIWAIIRV